MDLKFEPIDALTNSVLSESPHLNKLETGQRFLSEYYGALTSVRVIPYGKGVYSIYGYDKGGSPRDCLYPRDLTLLGKKITLSDVLLWHSLDGRNKYSHFEVLNSTGRFIIYDGEGTTSLEWDLTMPYLEDQKKELIDWLVTLI